MAVEDRDEETDLEALRVYNTNADDMIDATMPGWGDFRIWIDLNGDGFSDPDHPDTPGVNENDVFTLASLGSVGAIHGDRQGVEIFSKCV